MDAVKSALENNNMKAYVVDNRDEARKLVLSMIDKDDVVGSGGSVTLEECGIFNTLRKERNFLDWFTDTENKEELLNKTLTCDVLLMSSNAITQDGKLYNIDGRGNRLAAMIFGPKKVIIVAGKNKIVKNMAAAKERLETIAAPLNAKRLNKNTPCVKVGHCVDCDSPDRICRHTVITERQDDSQRINVIIVNEDLGL